MEGNHQKQLNEYYNDGALLTSFVDIMDFTVGVTPFLGTGDLIFNQDTLKKIQEGSLTDMASLCGSVASDFFVAAKVLKWARGFYAANPGRAPEILQLSSLASGCASVGFTGGYLWNKANDGTLGSYDYGRAALMGIELIGLITDRSSAQILKKYIEKINFKSVNCCVKKYCPTISFPPPSKTRCVTAYCNGLDPDKIKVIYNHIKGLFVDFPIKFKKENRAMPVIKKGMHIIENIFGNIADELGDMKSWFDLALNPETRKYYRVGNKGSQITMAELLTKHFFPNNPSVIVHSLDDIIKRSPPKIVIHDNGVMSIHLPEEAFSEKTYKDMISFAAQVRADPVNWRNYVGYPAGGKTTFPTSWSKCEIGAAIEDVLRQNGITIGSHGGLTKLYHGTYKGVSMTVGINHGDIITAYPTWLQP